MLRLAALFLLGSVALGQAAVHYPKNATADKPQSIADRVHRETDPHLGRLPDVNVPKEPRRSLGAVNSIFDRRLGKDRVSRARWRQFRNGIVINAVIRAVPWVLK